MLTYPALNSNVNFYYAHAYDVQAQREQSTNKVRTSREQAVYSFGIRLVFSWYFLGIFLVLFGIGLVLAWF